jgi:glutamate-1-semialdehyde 2,1-aminomutase
MTRSRSEALFQQAKSLIPGGVNSPVRAFRAVGGTPLFIDRAEGARLYDVDGNSYIDYVGSWGPMILGHGHPDVIEALDKALRRGTSYGAPTELEVEMAALVIECVPSLEMVRMVNSGTEATMSAIRLARGATGRDKVLKCEGCYHGHEDAMLVQAGSGAMTFGVPTSPGVPADVVRNTITLPYNNLEALETVLQANAGQVACLIVEPVPGNMGCVPPRAGYLEGLRELTAREGVLLIFDEVMSGFRLALGGAQERFGVTPDLTTLGKVIGGGLPVGAYGGSRALMERIAPTGPVYQAGTLSGNPLAMTAGLATLRALRRPGVYEALEHTSKRLGDGLAEITSRRGIDAYHTRVGSMFTTFFQEGPVYDYASALKSDTALFGRFFRAMLDRGVNLAPSQFEAGFVSLAHGDEEIARTLEAADDALASL